MWQDLVLSLVQWVFAFSLIPTVLHKTHKPTLSTGILTTTGLYTIAFVYSTLHLWGAVVGAIAVGTLWLIITIQRYRLNKRAVREVAEQ